MRLFLAGDAMLGRGIDQTMPHPVDPVLHESYVRSAEDYVRLAEKAHGRIARPVDPAHVWGDALDAVAARRADFRIVNLETSVTISPHAEPKGINYRMHPRNADALRRFGIDCCALANNHVLDWGEDGLVETLDTLRRLGIATAGAGRGRDEAESPAVLTQGDKRLLVFAAATPSSGVPLRWRTGPGKPGVFLLDDPTPRSVDALAALVAHHKMPGDLAMLSLHWGGNWGYDISREETAFAHALIERAGIDLLHGHSSHHPKAIEIYRGKLILYGCGDFINDYEGIGGEEDYRPDLALGYVADLDAAGRLLSLDLLPFRIERFSLRQLSAEDRHWLGRRLSRECGRFGGRIEATVGGLKLAWDGASH